MHITRAQLDEAAEQDLIQPQQAQALWAFLAERSQHTPSFKPAHILYYLGGLIAIGAMTLFMTLGWERFGGLGLLQIALAYGLLAVALTEWLVRRPDLVFPGGITAALAVVMVPLAVYGAQQALGWWPTDGAKAVAYRDYHTRIDWRWVFMELATLAAAAVALWRYRRPFLMLPVAVTLWYLSMDLVPLLFGGHAASVHSTEGKWVSVGFGLTMVVAALCIELRSRSRLDFAFWLYVVDVLTFWGGLTSLDSDSEWGKFVYASINLLLIAVGAALSRRVFAVFGGLGVALYLGHLSHTVFKDSLLFPVALTAIGLGVVAAGVVWQRHEATLGQRLRAALPTPLRNLLAQRAARA